MLQCAVFGGSYPMSRPETIFDIFAFLCLLEDSRQYAVAVSAHRPRPCRDSSLFALRFVQYLLRLADICRSLWLVDLTCDIAMKDVIFS